MQRTTTNDAHPGPIALWLSPLPVEIAPLLALLEQSVPTEISGHACWTGRLGETELCAAVCGGGPQGERVLLELLEAFPGARVMLVGMAGALDPALGIGDVVVANQALTWPEPEPALGATGGGIGAEALLAWASDFPFKVLSGCMLTWHEVVLGEREKARLRQRYGADCVDMETGYLARACAAQNVPLLAVRGISDAIGAREVESRHVAIAIWHATLAAIRALDRWHAETQRVSDLCR